MKSNELTILFQDMAALEKENLSKFYTITNKSYNTEEAIEIFRQEHEDDSNIIYFYKNDLLVAFMRYVFIIDKLRIKSLQLRKGHVFFIKHIANEFSRRVKLKEFEIVETKVHRINSASLVLHIKLGLRFVRNQHDIIVFRLRKADFLKAIKHLAG